MTTPTPEHAARLPTGTVSFFFSDIEGSTKLVEALGDRFGEVLKQHRTAMRRAFDEHGGVERSTEGDSFFVAFSDAGAAVAAAVAATRNLATVDWPDGAPVRVRIGVHTGEGRLVDDDYVGLDVHRAARIAAAGHGGQVLISQSTRILVERGLPTGVALRDLGEHRLKDLPAAEHLYQLDIGGLPIEFPPLRSLARVVINLPRQLPSIVGREAELEAIRALLERSRLVTVTGPGGTGKTRLVQEVARDAVATEPIDAVFVPLEALTEADLIPVEIIRALRLDVVSARDPMLRLAEHLAGRSTLLVLDNLEQLAGAGLVVKSLLDETADLAVLVSSQAALHIAGEQEYALAPLQAPGPAGSGSEALARIAESPAVRLFVERARAVRADFALDAGNAAAIVAICSRLDGLPLAIELAAAQVKLFSPDSILERVSGRLDALTSRRDDLPARHRTLRATVAWSYDLLPEDPQRLFRRLAAFSGGARLPEIEAIAAAGPTVPDPIGTLELLVDRSLVTVRPRAGVDRFALLETMRTFGRELLRERGEEAAVLGRHAAIYRDLAGQAEPEFYRASRRAWLDRLADDHDNLRAAFDQLVASGELSGALELAADLWRFWQQRGHLIEGRERLDELLTAAAAPGTPPIDPLILSRAQEAAGSIRYWMSTDRQHPRQFYERSLQLAIDSGDRRREAWAKYNLAFVFDFTPLVDNAEPDAARALALRENALAMFRELDDRRGIAESLWALGGNGLAMVQDPARARRLLNEALVELEQTGDLYGMGWANVSLGMLESLGGQLDLAEDRVLRAADLFSRDGDVAGEIVAVQALGSLAARRGDDLTAIRHGAAVRAAAVGIGAELPRIPPIVDPIEAAEGRVAPDDLRRERDIGVALGAQSILSTALETWRARADATEPGGLRHP